MNEFVPFIYILVLTLLGWVLSLLEWKRERKWITAIVAVLVVPMMFIAPALTHHDGGFSDLQLAVGVTALIWGAAALSLGWGGSMLLRAWWRRRR